MRAAAAVPWHRHLAAVLPWFLGGQGYWADWQATGQAVLAAAQAAGDQATLG